MKAKTSILLCWLALAILSVCTSCTPDDTYTNENNALLKGTWLRVGDQTTPDTFVFSADGTGYYKGEYTTTGSSFQTVKKNFTFDYDGELLTVQYANDADGHRFLCSLTGSQMTLTTTAYIHADGHVETISTPQQRTFRRMEASN